MNVTNPSRFLVLRHILLVGIFLLGGGISLEIFSSLPAHAASAHLTSTQSPHLRYGGATVLVIHGFNGASYGSGNGFNCSTDIDGMSAVRNYIKSQHSINGQNLMWTGNVVSIGYYRGDNCDFNLHSENHCAKYVPGGDFTNNESIYHLSCLLAWYIYDNYGQHSGWNIEIVAHSMGGLIVRNAIYQVQNRVSLGTGDTFPSTLGSISDVVTLSTPHGGIPGVGPLLACGNCRQANEMVVNSSFINEMLTKANNPQAGSTDWTLMGSYCDSYVSDYEAVNMSGGRKSTFLEGGGGCVGHDSILSDTSSNYDAHIGWCDGCGFPSPLRVGVGGTFEGWNLLTSAPHSLLHMMYALWLPTW